jgi:glycosyltransferase involved in cell wall biosynthesis
MSELSVLVPVYNEERTIAGVMQRIAVALPESQIIYIDDGSRDGSLARIREHARPRDIIMTKKNGGKGSAIREGLAKATGTFTVIQDADAEYDPSEIMRLLARAKELPGTIVFGSRFLTKNPNLYKRYLLGNKALTGFINLLFGVHLTDSYTCYKLFPTALMQSLPLRAK